MTNPMTEARLQKQILDALKMSPEIGGVQRVNVGGRVRRTTLAPTGTPDIFGWFNRGKEIFSLREPKERRNLSGVAFWIEVKLPGKNPTPEQAEFIEHANKTGAIAIVARSLEDIQWMI